jgi:DNA-binding NarL/FixJ family response regulator
MPGAAEVYTTGGNVAFGFDATVWGACGSLVAPALSRSAVRPDDEKQAVPPLTSMCEDDAMSSADPVSVLLADDERLIRAGLGLILEAEPDIRVVGEAADGYQAVERARALHPDVVLMDVRMPAMDGIDATRILASESQQSERQARVLILTTFNENDAVQAALRAGASGFILKSSAPRDVCEAIRAVARGAGWLDPDVTLSIFQELARHPEAALPGVEELNVLTSREREVLVALATGMSNAQIASKFSVSEGTVKTHMHRMYMKLGVSGRTQAAAVAYKCGLIERGS